MFHQYGVYTQPFQQDLSNNSSQALSQIFQFFSWSSFSIRVPLKLLWKSQKFGNITNKYFAGFNAVLFLVRETATTIKKKLYFLQDKETILKALVMATILENYNIKI